MERRRSPVWWLLAALVLLGLAALVQRACGTAPAILQLPPPQLPRVMRPAESKRMAERQVLTRPPQAQRHRDPVLSAVSAPGTSAAMVFEANALRNSPVGQLLLDCLGSLDEPDGGPSLALGKLREQGLDPLQDLDRVAFADRNVVVSGDFSRVNWNTLLASTTAEPYGEEGHLHSTHTGAVGAEGPVFGSWGTQLLVMAPSRGAAMAVLDRIEGRSPTGPLLSDNQAYGDMYGVLTGVALSSVFGPPNTPLSAQVQSAARSVELHLDATRDVGLVATVTGDDPGQLQDLGRALGGAIALERSQAVLTGDTMAAELLEYAQVTTAGGKVDVEVAVPFEVLRKLLASCGRKATVDAGR
jgi:hypothetical protein